MCLIPVCRSSQESSESEQKSDAPSDIEWLRLSCELVDKSVDGDMERVERRLSAESGYKLIGRRGERFGSVSVVGKERLILLERLDGLLLDFDTIG